MKKLLLGSLLFTSILASAQWNYVSTAFRLNTTLAVPSDSNIFYAAEQRTIFYSHNGGLNWNQFETEYEYEIFEDMDFVNDSVGFVCGGGWFSTHRNIVLRTTNAGVSWETLTRDSIGTYQFVFSKIDFVNIDSGLVYSSQGNELFRTIDAGDSWQQIYLDTPASFQIVTDIHFVNGSLGFIITEAGTSPFNKGRIYRTTDFGATWEMVRELDAPRSLYKIQFINESIGFIGGNQGRLYKTTDGGMTWTENYIPPGNSITALWFTDENTGYTNALGPVYKTSNGGMSWAPQIMNPINIVNNIQFSPTGNSGFLIAGNLLYKTTNGGGTASIITTDLNEQFTAYPNPSSGIVQLDYGSHLHIETMNLMDVRGRVVRTFSTNDRVLNVSGLSSGVYLLHIQTKEGVATKKIVLQ